MLHSLRIVRWLAAAVLGLSFVVSSGCGSPVQTCSPGEPGCSTSSCPQGCADDEVCSAGRCVPTTPQCEQAGQACVPGGQTRDGFLCIDWTGERAGTCSEFCAPDGSCPTGSSCFVLRSNFDTSCQATADCREDMVCIAGTCRYTACQPSECDGPVAGQQTCTNRYADDPNFPNGARCYEFGNEANYCLPAGTRTEGEACLGADAALDRQNFDQTCSSGLACVGGTCQAPCEFDQDCAEDQSCVKPDRQDVGFCATGCTPFEADSCGAGSTCRPISAEAGHCVPAGDKPAFSSCEPGAGDCAAGTLCIEYDTAGGVQEARCHPICDLSAAPPAEDGSLGEGGQEARDATCPQPPAALASLRLAHLAGALGPVDIYLSGRDEALVAGLDFAQTAPPSDEGGWIELEAGRYQLDVLPAGSPRTDQPIVQVTADLASGVGKTMWLAAAEPTSSDEAQGVLLEGADRAQTSAQLDIGVVHLLADAAAVDVVAVPSGADAGDPAQQRVLAEGLGFGEAASLVEAPVGEFRLIVFDAGASRTDPSAALLDVAQARPDADSWLALSGTTDPDDFATAGVFAFALGRAPATASQGTRQSCTALDGQVYGYCQQVCSGGAADFGAGVCDGDQMGCAPTEFPQQAEWRTLCAPVGDAGAQAPCDPRRPYGQCEEGYYCKQYGTGVDAGADGLLGRCTPLCEVGGDSTGPLGCEAQQSCQPLVYDGGYDIGRCGWTCEHGDDYADQSCPSGLQSCTPLRSLREDTSGQTAPLVREEQSFCAASGPVSVGQPCRGLDCEAGSECLYPRSQQEDLVSTLLSPYFGASGLAPTCHAQCDPFDADTAAFQCGADETCLFNYPWNAEVGHCAAVAERVGANQPCSQPGLACGEDSICTLVQGAPTCLRFCDYRGADAQGAFDQSTCPAGLVCEPFVSDIGWCQPPE